MAAHLGHQPAREALAKAKAAALRALTLDDSLAEAHALFGWLRACNDYDWAEAEQEFRLALALDRVSPTCHYRSGFYLRALGRLDEALVLARRARELEPLSLSHNWLPAYLLYLKREYDLALHECRQLIEWEPNYLTAYHVLEQVCAAKGMTKKAVAAGEKAVEIDGRSPFSLGVLGAVCGMLGRADEARKLLAEVDEIESRAYVPPVTRA